MEENYPLPEKPESLPGMLNVSLHLLPLEKFSLSNLITGEESVKELQRKRHSATPGVSLKGRVRKVAKWKPASDDGESDEDFERKLLQIE